MGGGVWMWLWGVLGLEAWVQATLKGCLLLRWSSCAVWVAGINQPTDRNRNRNARYVVCIYYIIFQISTAEWGFYSVCLRGGCVS